MKMPLGRQIRVAEALRGALSVTDRYGGDPIRGEDDEMLVILPRHAGRVVAGCR